MRFGIEAYSVHENAQGIMRPAKLVACWGLAAFVLNLVWEVGQLPLYTLRFDPDIGRIARWVLHCTAGDVLIALSGFTLAALCLRDVEWLFRAPVRGALIATLSGLAFTIFSEWRNVYSTAAWAYTDDMPLVFGIGLSPLLQWLVLPSAVLIAVRRVFRHPRGVAVHRAT